MAEITLESPKICERVLNITLESQDIQKGIDDNIKQYRKEVEIRGFRKGKAPKELIIARFGKQITQESIAELSEKAARDYIEEQKIEPISQIKFQDKEFNYKKGDDVCIVKISFEVEPEIEINYMNIPITVETYALPEDAVDKHIKSLQEKHATAKSVERPAQMGDLLIIEGEAQLEGEEKREPTNFPDNELILQDTLKPEFIEALVGANIGDTVEVATTFISTEDNEKEEKVTYYLTIQEIKERELSEIDDEFAKDLEYDSLEDMREKIRQNFLEYIDQQVQKTIDGKIIRYLLENNIFDVPQAMVQNALKNILEDPKLELPRGLSKKEKYELMLPRAIEEVRKYYIVNYIADQEAENIIPTKEELDERMQQMAITFERTVEEIKDIFKDTDYIENMEEEAKMGKLMKLLRDNAIIEKIEIKEEETDETTTEDDKEIVVPKLIVTPEEFRKEQEQENT